MTAIYALIAAIFAAVGAFFTGRQLTKKNEELKQDNESLKTVQILKEKTIKVYERSGISESEIQKRKQYISTLDDIDTLSRLFEEATKHSPDPNKNS